MDRLRQDKLKADDPTCQKYQVVLDLNAKDDVQQIKNKFDKGDYSQKLEQQRRRIEDSLAQAQQFSFDESKQLQFSIPDQSMANQEPETRFFQQLLMREAEHLMSYNEKFLDDLFKNDLIREEFENIRKLYGEEVFELNKHNLINFIKRDKDPYTYTVKYYGVNKDQLGILSRKVPFDNTSNKISMKSFRLPKLGSEPKQQDQPTYISEEFDLVEVEYSEEEEVSVEVDASDDDIIPLAQKPQMNNFDIVQGTVEGSEFSKFKKDSNPIQDQMNSEEPSNQVEQIISKKKKRIKEKRRVKKKKQVKRLKQENKLNANSRNNDEEINFMNINATSQSDLQQITDNYSKPNFVIAQEKDLNNTNNLHNQRIRSKSRTKQEQNSQTSQLSNMKYDKNDDTSPYLINFRELFKKVELYNLREIPRPEPEKYNKHMVNSYSLPKGLHASKKQYVLSESERFEMERYLKQNVNSLANFGPSISGLNGSKIKPHYFPIAHSIDSSSQSLDIYNQIAQPLPNEQNMEGLIKTIPLKSLKFGKMHNKSLSVQQSIDMSNNDNVIPDQSIDESLLKTSIIKNSHLVQAKYDHDEKASLIDNLQQFVDDKSKELVNLKDQTTLIQSKQLQSFRRQDNNDLTASSQDPSQLFPKKLIPDKSKVSQDQKQQIVSNQQSKLSIKRSKNQKKNNVRNQKYSDQINDEENRFALFALNLIQNIDKPKEAQVQNPQIIETLKRNATEVRINHGFQANNNIQKNYLMETKKILFKNYDKKNIQVNESAEFEEKELVVNGKKSPPNEEQSRLVLPKINSQNKLQKPNAKIQGYESTDTCQKSKTSQYQSTFNLSNVKVICRIRPPKSSGVKFKDNQQSQKYYTSMRQRSRSGCKELSTSSSIFSSQHFKGNQSKQTYQPCSRTQRSNSKQSSLSNRNKSQDKSVMNNSGFVRSDKKYCIFTTKEKSNFVVTTENPIPGKIVNESLTDLCVRNNLLGEQVQIFNFDQVHNESVKQERFYRSVVSPSIKSFVEGENACVVLFGPTGSGKSFTLKGRTGVSRGVLPRTVEDIFNIVKNSERREEDLEALNQRMMQSDDEEEQENSNFCRTYQTTRQNDEQVPERMFLRVQIYQIFADKVFDLLSNEKKTNASRAVIDQYIDKSTQEVVSKVSNITEKAVFSLEDFYSVLQEAFTNKRIQSSTMQEQDLRKKAHFVVGFTLMKRTQEKKLVELSHLNFLELSGSEQAVAEETFYQGSSIKQFVARSFNGISTQILKSALKKKQVTHEDGETKLVNCLRNTLTYNSNIILICNVNPSLQALEHSLPALKFCAKIRDCIIKKQSHKQNQNYNSQQDTSSNVSLDEFTYEQDIGSGRLFKTQESRGSQCSRVQNINENLIDEIDLIKDELANKKLQIKSISGHDLDQWVYEKQVAIERLLKSLNGDERRKIDSTQQMMYLKELEYLRDSIMKIKEDQRTSGSFTPRSRLFSLEQVQMDKSSYDSGSYYKYDKSIEPKASYDKCYNTYRQGQDSYQPLLSNEKITLASQQYQSQQQSILKSNTHTYPYKSHFSPSPYEQPPHDIHIQQRPNYREDIIVHRDNDYQNKTYMQGQIKNLNSVQIDISPTLSPNQQKDKTPFITVGTSQDQRILSGGYKSTQAYDNDAKQVTLKNPLSSYVSSPIKSQFSSQQNPFNSHPSKIDPNNLALTNLYQCEDDLKEDLSRLLKLGDQEGIKLRFTQLLKEKDGIEKAKKQQDNTIKEMQEVLSNKNELLEEQDKIIQQAHLEFQQNIDAIHQKTIVSEKSTSQQTLDLAQHMKDLQQKVNEMEIDKQKFIKEQEQLKSEIISSQKLKDDTEAIMIKLESENEKLKTNYEILKQHEMQVIKEFEGKKTREITFYEQKMEEFQTIHNEDRTACKAMEEQVFALREEIRKMDFDMEKLTYDKQNLKEEIAEMKKRQEEDFQENQDQKSQIQTLEQECSQLKQLQSEQEEQRQQVQEQTTKMHLLIEEMDKSIQLEQQHSQELTSQLAQKIQEIDQLQKHGQTQEEALEQNKQQLQNYCQNEEEYKRQLGLMGQMHEELEKQLVSIKAKDYDKIDWLHKVAELEARIKYLQVDNENLVKERNNLDIAHVNMQFKNQALGDQVLSLQQEMSFIRDSQGEHLDKFDQKFDQISSELSRLKQENIQLKEKDKQVKRQMKELEEERDELYDKIKLSDRRNQDLEAQISEIGDEVRLIMVDKEREIKESMLRQTMENKFKEENRGNVIKDIDGMIKKYKNDKFSTKSGYKNERQTNLGYSTSTSGY